MTTPTPEQIIAAAAGLSDPKARERAVRWLHRWQKAVPELFVDDAPSQQRRSAVFPWDAIDDLWVYAAMDLTRRWRLFSQRPILSKNFWQATGRYRNSHEVDNLLKFDPGNMPWHRSIVYRPGHEPGGGA